MLRGVLLLALADVERLVAYRARYLLECFGVYFDLDDAILLRLGDCLPVPLVAHIRIGERFKRIDRMRLREYREALVQVIDECLVSVQEGQEHLPCDDVEERELVLRIERDLALRLGELDALLGDLLETGNGAFLVASIGHSFDVGSGLNLNLGASAGYNINIKRLLMLIFRFFLIRHINGRSSGRGSSS